MRDLRTPVRNPLLAKVRKTVVLGIVTDADKLVDLGCIVTGLYNVANYHRRQEWQRTGKIPNYYQQYYALREHRLAKLLHSHVAQQVLRSLDYSYRSWLALCRCGHANAKPPLFRKPCHASTLHFTRYGFRILDDAHIRLSSKNAFGENIIIKVRGRPDVRISRIRALEDLTDRVRERQCGGASRIRNRNRDERSK
jgi:CDGSH-type Zn-finger protein